MHKQFPIAWILILPLLISNSLFGYSSFLTTKSLHSSLKKERSKLVLYKTSSRQLTVNGMQHIEACREY
jgi:hypothetical protein